MSTSFPINRRSFLLAGAAAAGGFVLAPYVSLAQTRGAGRFVFIILRGALDGLSAVPPYGDPDYARLRRELALGPPGSSGGCLRLDDTFGLHPSLGFLHESYRAGELAVIHAAATAYRERSHSDGQDVLENGLTQPHALQTGWLNRALASLAATGSASVKESGVALGQNVPLLMRGPAAVVSWSPSRLVALDDTRQGITDRYASDPVLSHRLADALASNAIANGWEAADNETAAMAAGPGNTGAGTAAARAASRYVEVVRATAGFLRAANGPRVAVFDTTGWDTHANEGNAQGQLAARLAALDAALKNLKDELGPAWRDTAIMIATEFGRTAATNGTRGTDHGTGSAAFLLGGAVQGRRVIADWPGLSVPALYQGRDLRPTIDLRSIMKGVLADQLRVPGRVLESDVFPGSAAARGMQDLIRV